MSTHDKTFIPNPSISISKIVHDLAGKWIERDTAILIVHGIGDQNPLETIDQFGRGLIKALRKSCKLKFKVSHGLAKKEQSGGLEHWFDNFIRIEQIDEEGKTVGPHLDVYEYYWAHFTEDQMDLTDISAWVGKVTSGAKKFYRDNMELGINARDQSVFFVKGKFIYWRYMFFVYLMCAFIPSVGFFSTYLLKWLSNLPLGIGIPFRWINTWFMESGLKHVTNIIGDITVYNTTDEKCKFYKVRQDILAGSVKSLVYLIGSDDNKKPRYEKVLVAGHSLGTQIAYDAINRLIHLVSEGEISGYNNDGTSKLTPKVTLASVLSGFITFGSPLDKIAFFLREQVPDDQYIRKQLLLNFHCFKQRDWNFTDSEVTIEPIFKRLLDEIRWTNYFDKHDTVSGSLDYYQALTNVDCEFKANFLAFTHSRYWTCEAMYENIISDFILD